MTAAEEGVLLLCCRLGDPECKPLTLPQFRDLGQLVRASAPAGDPLREMNARDLTALGYPEERAEEILRLLDRSEQLRRYLQKAESMGIYPITRLSEDYPVRLARQLRYGCPAVLFARGDRELLRRPSVAVVGSRKLLPENGTFARQSGEYLAERGLTLVSGGAAGADLAAQEACLTHGGTAVIFPADRLQDYPAMGNCLYLSPDGFDVSFSAARALNRNRLIHIQAEKTLAVQCSHEKGGTWQGCQENLKHRWSPLYVFDDGSAGMQALQNLGAIPVTHPAMLEREQESQLQMYE